MKIDSYIPLESGLLKFQKIAEIGKGSFGEVNLVRLLSKDDDKTDIVKNDEIDNVTDVVTDVVDQMNNPYGGLFAIKRSYSKLTTKGHLTHILQDSDWEREYTLLSLLNHDSIIQVYYLFKIIENGEQINCLVMEYFPGVDLNVFINKNRKICKESNKRYQIPIRDQLIIIKGILNVIRYLHGMGIIHRDIKPGNIMYNDKHGKIKLIDFTFASYYLDYPTTPEQHEYVANPRSKKGTPLYMSRESIYNTEDAYRVQNRSDLVKCDIWAMGVSIYHIISGFEPYNASSYKNFKKLMLEPPLPVYGIYHTPPVVESLIQDCLMVDYRDRPDINILCDYFLPKLNKINVTTDRFGNELFSVQYDILNSFEIFEFDNDLDVQVYPNTLI
jgi:serine/threonine protein kinase